MIKKITFPFIILVICFLLVINYLAYKSPVEAKMITQKKVYSLTKDNNLEVYIYSNKKTAYNEKDAIDVIYLENSTESKKVELELLNIIKINKHSYLKEDYTKYKYTFKLKELDSYFYIEEAYLYFRLKNNNDLKVLIGSFDYYKETENLNVVELFGKRFDHRPSIKSVSIKFNLTEEIFVEHIYLSKNIYAYVGKIVKDNELLTVEFNETDKIIDALTIKIDYQQNGEYYTTNTPYFIFYETNENPLSYSFLNNVYLLD